MYNSDKTKLWIQTENLLRIKDSDINRQDRQCMYNITIRRDAMEKQYVLHIPIMFS